MPELEYKYLVLKWEDIQNALKEYEKDIFQRMISCVGEYRAFHGKPENHYVVVNLDESYADQVLALVGVERNVK